MSVRCSSESRQALWLSKESQPCCEINENTIIYNLKQYSNHTYTQGNYPHNFMTIASGNYNWQENCIQLLKTVKNTDKIIAGMSVTYNTRCDTCNYWNN